MAQMIKMLFYFELEGYLLTLESKRQDRYEEQAAGGKRQRTDATDGICKLLTVKELYHTMTRHYIHKLNQDRPHSHATSRPEGTPKHFID
jgi:hypothetical protein